ncbi:MAG: glycoside hydrolase family 11 protein [Defluviitaleaceae bacterium]|nr:glycoside hydrolase family 11 protein [Defluviitaleaceae bacterium]
MPELKTRIDVYKYFPDNTVNCHWHTDFEFGLLLEGAIDLFVNDTCIKLQKGNGFFVKPNTLHMSKQVSAEVGNEKDAVVFVLNFPASFFAADINGVIYEKYFTPFLNTKIEGVKIASANEPGQNIISLLEKVYAADENAFGYELECLKNTIQIWQQTLRYINEYNVELHYGAENKQTERIKKLLSFIHERYGEKFSADDIANHLNVSRGECFRCFKHFMNKRLVEYINEYRLQRAAAYLRETDISISEISTKCGFENPGYFGKIFREMYHITPLAYRKAQIWTANKAAYTNGYDYQYWKDHGNGRMIITSNANNGSFLCEWSNVHNTTFRSGKKFYERDKTYRQIGKITLKYDASFNSSGSTYLCVYGWTVDPLVEWYIVEAYSAHMPMRNHPLVAEHTIDGNTYDVFHVKRNSMYTILGVEGEGKTIDFDQYWSIRKSEFSHSSINTNGIVDVSKHFLAWENIGFKMGKIAEVALTVESDYSSGSAVVKTNIIEIDKSICLRLFQSKRA